MSIPIPGHAKLVEVWNPDQKSFYQACLQDIHEGTGMADVQFIGSPESQQIPLNQLRPCQPSQTDPSMQYNDREAVEVRFELEGQGPSWWEGAIKGGRITNDPPSYLVTFDDAEYTNTFSTQLIRKAAFVPRMTLKKSVLPIPYKVAMHADISKLDSTNRLFCLRLIKDALGHDFIIVIGYPEDVDNLCDPISWRFQISQLERVADLNIQVARVQSSNPKHREVTVFHIPESLVGLSLGKGGERIQDLQKSKGIYSILVDKHPSNGRVKVTIESKTVADAEACREAFELEEHRIDSGGIDFKQAPGELDDLKKRSGILVAKIESSSHIVCIGTREGLKAFHKFLGLYKVLSPDIFAAQKELRNHQGAPSFGGRPGGYARGGNWESSSGDSRSQRRVGRGGHALHDPRPVPSSLQQQQQKLKGQDPAKITICSSASGRSLSVVSEQAQQQKKQQQQQHPVPPQAPKEQKKSSGNPKAVAGQPSQDSEAKGLSEGKPQRPPKIKLTHQALFDMSSKEVAEHVTKKSGVFPLEPCIQALTGQIYGRTYKQGWFRDDLSELLTELPYFVAHPKHLEPVIRQLVKMREEAEGVAFSTAGGQAASPAEQGSAASADASQP